MLKRRMWSPVLALAGLFVAGCSLAPAGAPPDRASRTPQPTSSSESRLGKLDPQQAERLRQIMPPLIQAMNKPLPLNQVQVGVQDDPHINAASAGGGKFLVTTGLLQKANDDQLRAVLAHELAHQDLGHVAKTQTVGTGLQIGAVLLDQLFPNIGGTVGQIAGQLALNAYTRNEEYAADHHGVEILRKAGYDGKTLMAQTLMWLEQTEGAGGGGFFANHPATGDRVQAVQRMP